MSRPRPRSAFLRTQECCANNGSKKRARKYRCVFLAPLPSLHGSHPSRVAMDVRLRRDPPVSGANLLVKTALSIGNRIKNIFCPAECLDPQAGCLFWSTMSRPATLVVASASMVRTPPSAISLPNYLRSDANKPAGARRRRGAAPAALARRIPGRGRVPVFNPALYRRSRRGLVDIPKPSGRIPSRVMAFSYAVPSPKFQ